MLPSRASDAGPDPKAVPLFIEDADTEGQCPYCGALADEACNVECDADEYEDEAY